MQDLRYATRGIVRNPGFAITVILTLALGIGATTSIVGLAEAVLLRPLPYGQPDRLAMIFTDFSRGGFPRGNLAPAHIMDLRQGSSAFSETAGMGQRDVNLTGDGEPERLKAGAVTANFLDVLRVKPLHGRGFIRGEDTPGRDDVVVLGHGLWQRRFAADPSIIGTSIRLNGRPHRVVGILPPGFQFYLKWDMFTPLAPKDWSRRDIQYLYGVSRLKDGRGRSPPPRATSKRFPRRSSRPILTKFDS
jgi:hypothetical protein